MNHSSTAEFPIHCTKHALNNIPHLVTGRYGTVRYGMVWYLRGFSIAAATLPLVLMIVPNHTPEISPGTVLADFGSAGFQAAAGAAVALPPVLMNKQDHTALRIADAKDFSRPVQIATVGRFRDLPCVLHYV